MTGLLTIAAVVALIILLSSASTTGSKATAGDAHTHGPWGIAHWTSTRQRPLNPHERRWQTALVSARDNTGRWRDLVAEIVALERINDTSAVGPPPAKFDRQWLEASIANLELAADDKTPGDLPS